MDFNSKPSYVMLMDINSCFATIEQQANPFLRGRPIVVAAYTSASGAILAASYEAKKLGIKTGMRVADGKSICPSLKILLPDPHKYRFVHLKLAKIISEYTDDFAAKSIDEFFLNLKDYPALKNKSMQGVAGQIKEKIKTEIGEWITVSIGIAPNRYLAKIAANIKKPDGLVEINKDNFLEVYSKLKLTDLTGIKVGNARRLNSMGIYTVLDFYQSPIWKLKAAFHSITGLYWHTRLRGYEIDKEEFKRRSYGNSVAIGRDVKTKAELSPILARLTEKTAFRLRQADYKARCVHLAIVYKDGTFWHKGGLLQYDLESSQEIFRVALNLLSIASPKKSVRNIAVSVFSLVKHDSYQPDLFEKVSENKDLTKASDLINKKWGDFTLHLGRSLLSKSDVKDRIAFGGVKELEGLQSRQP